MKRWIYMVGVSLLLTGCSTESVEIEDNNVATIEDTASIEYTSEEGMYLNDDMKEVILDINALREKYKDAIDDRGPDSLYINIYEDSVNWIKDIEFDNNQIHNVNYFNDLIEVLDKSIASGLKDYISQMKNKALEYDDIITKKIGRTVVYTENRDRSGGNYISIKMNLLDIKDDYYRDIFNNISDDKYILDKLVMGKDLNLIDFVNINNIDHRYNYSNLSIRYNMFFKDKDFTKVNILVQGEKGKDLEYDDIGVFIKLINRLNINKQEEKDQLVDEYKNILKEQSTSKKISLDNYDLLIKSGKGDTYTGNNGKLVYFSIQAKE